MTSEPTTEASDAGARAVTEPDSPAPHVSKRALTVGMCTTVVAVAFEVIAVATAMPAAARALDGLPYYAWSFSAFMIGMLFATVGAGRLSDRIGPAKPLLGGLLLFCVGLVVAATAPVMAQLVGGRLIQGLGSGVINTALYVLIAQVFTPRQRPRVFTFISTAWILPAFVGPPISAWLSETYSWRWVFWAVLPLVAIGVLMILPTLLGLTRTPHRTPVIPAGTRPASLRAAAVLAIAAASLQLAGQRLDVVAVGLLVVGLVGLGLTLPRLMPAGFVRVGRGLPAVVIVRGLLPGAFFGSEAFIPLMLVEQRGLSLFWAGAMLSAGSIGWFAGSWLQSRPWLALRRDRLITYGCASVAVGVAVIALTATQPSWWFGLVGVGWAFAGLGMGLSMASTNLTVMTVSRTQEQGRNASSLNVSDALGSAIAVGVTGTIFAALQPSGDLVLAFGALLAAMVIVSLVALAVSFRVGTVENELARDELASDSTR